MKRSWLHRWVWVGSALTAGGISPAFAAPGDHIRPNDTVTIVPRVDLAMEYRTNVYRTEVDPTPAANTRLSPGLDVTAEGPDHEFSLGAQWDLRKYIFVGEIENTAGEPLAGVPPAGERVTLLDRYNDFNVGADARLFKQSQVGFVLSDRIAQRNNSVDSDYSDNPYTTQLRNALVGGIRYSPTGAVSLTPTGFWAYDNFKIAGVDEPYNSRHTYGPQLDVKWAFFPRTSFVIATSYLFYNWDENVIVLEGQETASTSQNSEHFQIRAGVEGRFTARLLADLSLGYGIAMYDEPAAGNATGASDDVTGVDGLLATAQLRYLLSDDSEVFGGYQRGFTDMFFTNFVVYNYLYTGTSLELDDWKPSLKYGVRLEEYGGVVARNDVYHRLNADLGYDLEEWATLSAGTALQARVSPSDVAPQAEYSDWNIHLLAHLTY